MNVFREIKSKKKIMGKLDCGCDLLGGLTEICKNQHITSGFIQAIGAVQKACIGFYDQQTHEYHITTLNRPLEIVSLIGNISIKDGEPFVHAHITLADETEQAYGGHLAPGTIVFACEFILEIFEGESFIRSFDNETGLSLWNI